MAVQSKQLEKIINTVVSVGAAVVIFGAWAKILHKSYADVMLTVGLLTEAAIFLIYAFLPPAGGEMAEVAEALKKGMPASGSSSNDELKKLLEQEINPENLKKLNESFAKFNQTVQGLTTIANVTEMANDFAAKAKEASAALAAMNAFYENLNKSAQTMQNSADDAKKTQEQIALLAKNLGSLNSVYNNMLAAMQGRG
ncbi:MAG: gliding motility protein GldL [Bacteroidota bacterium]|jgi:phage-related minor tail protein